MNLTLSRESEALYSSVGNKPIGYKLSDEDLLFGPLPHFCDFSEIKSHLVGVQRVNNDIH